MTVQEIFNSKNFRIGALVVGVLLIAGASFVGGVVVGVHKTLFSTQWGKNYERNFLRGDDDDRWEKRSEGFFGGMRDMRMWIGDQGMRNAHGIAGDILSLSGDTIIIKNLANQESTVRFNDQTIVNRGRDTVSTNDLGVGERVTVIGKPQDDGTIAATFIRIFPTVSQ